jgi:hypothetical protein
MNLESKTQHPVQNALRWVVVIPASIATYLVVWYCIQFLTPFLSFGSSIFGQYAPILFNAFVSGSAFIMSGSAVAPYKKSAIVPIVLTVVFGIYALSAIFGFGVAPGKNVSGGLEIFCLIFAVLGCAFTTFIKYSSGPGEA